MIKFKTVTACCIVTAALFAAPAFLSDARPDTAAVGTGGTAYGYYNENAQPCIARDDVCADGVAECVSIVPDGYEPVYDAIQFSAIPDYSDGKYILMNDITVLDADTQKTFCGVFDGNGHTVTVKSENKDSYSETAGGLFARIKGTKESPAFIGNITVTVEKFVFLTAAKAASAGMLAAVAEGYVIAENVYITLKHSPQSTADNEECDFYLGSVSERSDGMSNALGGVFGSVCAQEITLADITVDNCTAGQYGFASLARCVKKVNAFDKEKKSYSYTGGFIGIINSGAVRFENLTLTGAGNAAFTATALSSSGRLNYSYLGGLAGLCNGGYISGADGIIMDIPVKRGINLKDENMTGASYIGILTGFENENSVSSDFCSVYFREEADTAYLTGSGEYVKSGVTVYPDSYKTPRFDGQDNIAFYGAKRLTPDKADEIVRTVVNGSLIHNALPVLIAQDNTQEREVWLSMSKNGDKLTGNDTCVDICAGYASRKEMTLCHDAPYSLEDGRYVSDRIYDGQAVTAPYISDGDNVILSIYTCESSFAGAGEYVFDPNESVLSEKYVIIDCNGISYYCDSGQGIIYSVRDEKGGIADFSLPFVVRVNPAPAVISVNNVSAVYGSLPEVYSAIVTGEADGEKIEYDLVLQPSDKYRVGNYPVLAVIRQDSAVNANYDIRTQDGILTITPATAYPVIYSDEPFVYDGSSKEAKVMFEGVCDGDELVPQLLYNGQEQATEAGDYAVTLYGVNGADSTNYVFASANKYVMSIEKGMPRVNPIVSGDMAVEGCPMPHIGLGAGDTAGKIAWEDESALLVAGYADYNWIFIPDSGNYKTVRGLYTIFAERKKEVKITAKKGGNFCAEYTFGEDFYKDGIQVFLHFNNGEVRQLAAGEYSVSSLYAGARSVRVSYNGMYADVQGITVARASVALPDAQDDFVYDGKAHTLTAEESDLYILTGDVTATEAGIYNASAVLTDPDNYEWVSGGSSADIVWIIRKAPQYVNVSLTLGYGRINISPACGSTLQYSWDDKTFMPVDEEGIDVPLQSEYVLYLRYPETDNMLESEHMRYVLAITKDVLLQYATEFAEGINAANAENYLQFLFIAEKASGDNEQFDDMFDRLALSYESFKDEVRQAAADALRAGAKLAGYETRTQNATAGVYTLTCAAVLATSAVSGKKRKQAVAVLIVLCAVMCGFAACKDGIVTAVVSDEDKMFAVAAESDSFRVEISQAGKTLYCCDGKSSQDLLETGIDYNDVISDKRCDAYVWQVSDFEGGYTFSCDGQIAGFKGKVSASSAIVALCKDVHGAMVEIAADFSGGSATLYRMTYVSHSGYDVSIVLY